MFSLSVEGGRGGFFAHLVLRCLTHWQLIKTKHAGVGYFLQSKGLKKIFQNQTRYLQHARSGTSAANLSSFSSYSLFTMNPVGHLPTATKHKSSSSSSTPVMVRHFVDLSRKLQNEQYIKRKSVRLKILKGHSLCTETNIAVTYSLAIWPCKAPDQTNKAFLAKWSEEKVEMAATCRTGSSSCPGFAWWPFTSWFSWRTFRSRWSTRSWFALAVSSFLKEFFWTFHEAFMFCGFRSLFLKDVHNLQWAASIHKMQNAACLQNYAILKIKTPEV